MNCVLRGSHGSLRKEGILGRSAFSVDLVRNRVILIHVIKCKVKPSNGEEGRNMHCELG